MTMMPPLLRLFPPDLQTTLAFADSIAGRTALVDLCSCEGIPAIDGFCLPFDPRTRRALSRVALSHILRAAVTPFTDLRARLN